jgi:hypothetical protein
MADHEKRQDFMNEDPNKEETTEKATHNRSKENTGMKDTNANMDFDDTDDMGEIEER